MGDCPLSAPHFPGQWDEQEDGLAAQGILPQDHHPRPNPVELTGTSGETERSAWFLADFLEVVCVPLTFSKVAGNSFPKPSREEVVG